MYKDNVQELIDENIVTLDRLIRELQTASVTGDYETMFELLPDFEEASSSLTENLQRLESM